MLNMNVFRCLRCETVPIGRFYKLFAVMLDRVRLPSPGGAVRLTWKHVLPFVVYPVLVYSGAYGAFICALGFLLVLYGYVDVDFGPSSFVNRDRKSYT